MDGYEGGKLAEAEAESCASKAACWGSGGTNGQLSGEKLSRICLLTYSRRHWRLLFLNAIA